MSNVPQELQYTAEHEYVRRTEEEGVVVVGITDYAQDQLGDVVFVELPKVGARFERMEVFANESGIWFSAQLTAAADPHPRPARSTRSYCGPPRRRWFPPSRNACRWMPSRT